MSNMKLLNNHLYVLMFKSGTCVFVTLHKSLSSVERKARDIIYDEASGFEVDGCCDIDEDEWAKDKIDILMNGGAWHVDLTDGRAIDCFLQIHEIEGIYQ